MNGRLQDNRLTFFDELAALTREPDASFEELRRIYEHNDRLRAPAIVFNSLLNQPEAVSALAV